MYCPRCGRRLAEIGGSFRCEYGQMDLAPDVARGLVECFVTRTRRPAERALPFEVGGAWFCPDTGSRMEEREGVVRCTCCGRSLNEFIPALVERHPHSQTPDG